MISALTILSADGAPRQEAIPLDLYVQLLKRITARRGKKATLSVPHTMLAVRVVDPLTIQAHAGTPLDLGSLGLDRFWLLEARDQVMCSTPTRDWFLALTRGGKLLTGPAPIDTARPPPAPSEPTQERLRWWRLHGEVGASSQALVDTFESVPLASTSHPHDLDDLRRCVLLLDLVPEARSALHALADRSACWRVLVEVWDELTPATRDDATKELRAATYQRMRELLTQARKEPRASANPSWPTP